MSVRVGPYTFREVVYDAPSDVLYAAIDRMQPGSRERTPEGHLWHFDRRGRFQGITLMGPREQLEREGSVYVTLPSGERERVQGADLELRVDA